MHSHDSGMSSALVILLSPIYLFPCPYIHKSNHVTTFTMNLSKFMGDSSNSVSKLNIYLYFPNFLSKWFYIIPVSLLRW